MYNRNHSSIYVFAIDNNIGVNCLAAMCLSLFIIKDQFHVSYCIVFALFSVRLQQCTVHNYDISLCCSRIKYQTALAILSSLNDKFATPIIVSR